jgi:Ca2+-binding RTX toxin-like protein
MKTPLLLLLVMLGGAIGPPSASAGTITFNGGAFAFTASPGEGNHIRLDRTTDCQTLPAPCVLFNDVLTTTAPAACLDTGFTGILCPLPTSVTVALGDKIDYYRDWDGPSVVHAGPGEDLINGAEGNDVLFGEVGGDSLVGGPGDDRVDGGPGTDFLDSYLVDFEWPADPSDSAGTDVLIGGAGADIASYEQRLDQLMLSKDGRANDGADGENDTIADDVEEVRGGHADDALVGGPGADQLRGGDGDDVMTGAGGQDYVDGGDGDDAVAGGDGDDGVAGGGGSDLVVGGPGRDALFGEYLNGCAASIIGCSDGDDEIRAQDGETDGIDCGGGEDAVYADPVDALTPGAACEAVAGAAAQSCAQVPRSVRPTCRIVMRAVKACADKRGAKQKRCLERAVKRASKSCRKRFRGRHRRSCLRSVRRLVK